MKRAMHRQVRPVVGMWLLVLGSVLVGIMMGAPRARAGGEGVSERRPDGGGRG